MTYHPKSEFMNVMMTRGFLADCTDYQGLDEALSKGVTPAYIGFDATASSLHVGSLIQIILNPLIISRILTATLLSSCPLSIHLQSNSNTTDVNEC